jgi:hypothetical protein
MLGTQILPPGAAAQIPGHDARARRATKFTLHLKHPGQPDFGLALGLAGLIGVSSLVQIDSLVGPFTRPVLDLREPRSVDRGGWD